MKDRELLEMAEKACGYTNPCYEGDALFCFDGDMMIDFNPLLADCDAFRLAVNLRMDVLQDAESISVKRYVGPDVDHQYLACEHVDGNRLKATRRAIVIAAAEIGKSMP